MRIALLFAIVFYAFSGFSQINPRVNNSFNYQFEKSFYDREEKTFTSFKPSFSDSGLVKKNKSLIHHQAKGQDEWLRWLKLNPLFEISTGLENKEFSPILGFGAGLRLDASMGKKWRINLSGIHLNKQYMSYQKAWIIENETSPGTNLTQGSNFFSSQYFSSFINYQANDWINMEFGYGRNFIGDGYRSLLLSNNANANPYLKISTEFWHFQYTNLFTQHRNIFGANGKSSNFEIKYTATHFLDWKITKWISLGLFETVVWETEEGTYKRGFDVNYLNPVIFYRPIEFSTGSSDNVLVGANLKISLPKRHVIYIQGLLDEFLLAELRADLSQSLNPEKDIESGWWANKYGIQLGLRSFDLFGMEGLSSRLEYNIVRPFTYAHTSSSQAYAHDNMPLAHPLGSNFEELVFHLDYQSERQFYSLKLNWASKGLSTGLENLGDNVQFSNTTRTKEYENYIGQGVRNNKLTLDLSSQYVLNFQWLSSLKLGLILRNESFSNASETRQMIYLSLQTNLRNRAFDF